MRSSNFRPAGGRNPLFAMLNFVADSEVASRRTRHRSRWRHSQRASGMRPALRRIDGESVLHLVADHYHGRTLRHHQWTAPQGMSDAQQTEVFSAPIAAGDRPCIIFASELMIFRPKWRLEWFAQKPGWQSRSWRF